jgi:hypothetical protein
LKAAPLGNPDACLTEPEIVEHGTRGFGPHALSFDN